ncbi:endonuclease/exonuclease/phosphatase family protein [Neobacillus niacini]|uniref:endonuclease/exonuclease/phosphatase family protein n=1 Tax=Neobacillus niacini TaxID=86668 RepID=UPI002FFF95EB
MNWIGKKLWFTLLFLLTFTFLNGSSIYAMSAEIPGRQVDVKVMTYNIHTGIGADGKYDLMRIANVIRNSGTDIIGLQEVDVHWSSRSQYQNQIELLANELDMFYFFAPIYSFDPLVEGEPRREYGVAILSKHPIIEATNRDIARLSTQEANPVPKPAPGYLEALINVKGSKVWVYVTHLDYRGDPTVRQMQVADMLNISGQHEYNIIAGDMNAGPGAPELQPLFEKYVDTWRVTNEGTGLTYPAVNPSKRIDYILSSPLMDVKASQVIDTHASDHLPVIAEITLLRGNQP